MNFRDGLIILVVLGLIVGIFFVKQEKEPVAPGKIEVRAEEGYTAPNFTLDALSGEKISLEQDNGKPTLVQFWASWCGICQQEMPGLQRAYNRYKDQVRFLMVNGTHQDDEHKVASLMKEKGYTFPVLLDKDGSCFTSYGVQGLPTSFLISSKGIILLKKIGAMTESELDDALQKSLTRK